MELRRLARLFGVAAVAISVAGASWPALSHRLPRFFFVTLGLLGGVFALVSFVNVLRRAFGACRAGGRLPIVRLLVSATVLILLVALPVARFVGMMRTPAPGAAPLLARFGDWIGGEGYPRLSAHRGIDVGARPGSDVLAAADGRVVVARDNADLCGLLVVIVHDPHGYRTAYCHFSAIVVQPGEAVRRGQRIGAVGSTGQRPWPGYEHVHLELQRGSDVNAVEDPLPRIVGCFEEQMRYPTERLVLTYPVPCR
jgi:murein DD-endopeptidase MepM/ murein hydrolase activator NlpD